MPGRLVVVALLAFALTGSAAAVPQPSASAPNLVQAENALPGTPGWLAPDAGSAIEGYTADQSLAPGDTLQLHVSVSPAQRYRVLIYRLGWYGGAGARLLGCLPSCAADEQGFTRTVPPLDPQTGKLVAGWPATDQLAVPRDWVSGYYLAELMLTTGPAKGQASPVVFVVRAPPMRASAILVQVPVNTWAAYNAWGGKSLYGDYSTNGTPAVKVSFERPLGKPYRQFFTWEIQLMRFLEREGYDVSYQTDIDTDRNPGELLRHRLVMTAGHGEYWTRTMRDAFDHARDLGTNLAFMGSNIAYWNVRYEDNWHTVVGYKSFAPDPVPDPTQRTILFRDLGMPECELLGIEHIGGIERGPSTHDYAIEPRALRDGWLRGVGFTASTVLPNLVGPEWDTIPQSLPAPCFKARPVIYFRGRDVDATAMRYTAPSGARVFSSGSLQFVWGLDSFGAGDRSAAGAADTGLQQFTRNALADLTTPAPAWSLHAVSIRGRVRVWISRPTDPRVTNVIFLRREGRQTFDAKSVGTSTVCTTIDSICLDRSAVRGHVYRYLAIVADQWGTSSPTETSPVTVR